MYSTRTREHARIPNGHPGEEKRACRTKVRGQVGELNGPRAPRHANCRARIFARKSARKSVSVFVSVPWNLSFSYLKFGTFEFHAQRLILFLLAHNSDLQLGQVHLFRRYDRPVTVYDVIRRYDVTGLHAVVHGCRCRRRSAWRRRGDVRRCRGDVI